MLVIDDEPDVRRSVAGILADHGYDVHTALDDEHALRSVVALSPDLILLDIRLPDPTFSQRFADEYRRRVPPERQAPIVVLSASREIADYAERLGAVGHIAKPFDADDLVRVVRSCFVLADADPPAHPVNGEAMA
ncbi:MAG: response regulator [Chloroflexi bacterium]|nr:response regulator [Chloroflexota bacterium]